jgi:hypothetical protein
VTSYQQELVEVLRRIAERGKRFAEGKGNEVFVDLFVHLMDEIDRLKKASGDER